MKKNSGVLYWGSGPLAESDLAGTITSEYIFFNGQRIARVDPPCCGGQPTYRYYFSDHLGSASVVTDQNGVIKDESDYYPYGGERTVVNNDPNHFKFTGKERDTETGLDYFGARYLTSGAGRFMSVDPVIITPERLLLPQQLNRYAYVANNPLRFIDPTGEVLITSLANRGYLCQLVGAETCGRISINAETGVVSFNTEGLDLSNNEGALLLSQVVDSAAVYGLALSDSELTAAGYQPMIAATSNLDRQFDTRLGRPKRNNMLPPDGVDDQITIDPKRPQWDSLGRLVPISNLMFHELAEAYAKIDGGRQYEHYQNVFADGDLVRVTGPIEQGAHSIANQRELKWRGQSAVPNIQSTGRAGDQLKPAQIIQDAR